MRPLSHVVPAAVAQLLQAAPLSSGKVRFAWRLAVGPAMDRSTRVRLERDALIVEAASPEWAREARRLSGIVLARMQTFMGADAVKRIEVRVVPNTEVRSLNSKD